MEKFLYQKTLPPWYSKVVVVWVLFVWIKLEKRGKREWKRWSAPGKESSACLIKLRRKEREMEGKHEITGVSKKVGRAVYLLLFRMHVFLSSKKKKQERERSSCQSNSNLSEGTRREKKEKTSPIFKRRESWLFVPLDFVITGLLSQIVTHNRREKYRLLSSMTERERVKQSQLNWTIELELCDWQVKQRELRSLYLSLPQGYNHPHVHLPSSTLSTVNQIRECWPVHDPRMGIDRVRG